jgi:protein phosphatase
MSVNHGWHFAGATDRGLVRKRNEDAFLVSEEMAIVAVADGMGGRAGGDVASRLAVRFISRMLGGEKTLPPTLDGEKLKEKLQGALMSANGAIMQSAFANPDLEGMGSTIVVCLVRGETLHAVHMGDSRLYVADEAKLTQVTEDHSYVARVLGGEELTDDEVAKHPKRNVITRALGYEMAEPAEYTTSSLEGQRRILLCTDGLWSLVPRARLLRVLFEAPTPEEACAILIEDAKRAGGNDNITAVIGFRG